MQVCVDDVLCRREVHSCLIIIFNEAHFDDTVSGRATPDMYCDH